MFEKRKLLVIVWMHEYFKGMLILNGLLRVAPIDLQLVGVANPSMKEPARVAFTTIAVIVQSISQNESRNVDHDDGI